MEIECDKKECDGDCPGMMVKMADEILSMGELIVYPTETLYGLGGDALDIATVDKIRKVKQAPEDKKISVAYNSLEHASNFIDIPELAWNIEEEFLPGPLTLVVERGNSSEGIRIPDHPVAQKIIERFGPITSTSANLHGMADPIEKEDSKMQLGDDVRLYIDCGRGEYNTGTTVIKVDEEIELLREGVISMEEITERIGDQIGR